MATKSKSQITAEPLEEGSLDSINRKYAYVLAEKNEGRGQIWDDKNRPVKEKEYKPKQNLLLKSAIIWDGSDCVWEDPQTKKKLISGHKPGKYFIRYYDGCTTLFIDEQPKEKETLDGLIANTREVLFLDGFLFCYGYDDMFKKYLDICSWNGESPYRIPTVNAVFVPVDADSAANKEADKLDKIEEALEFARSADDKKMMTHARFLGVPEVDSKTGNPLSMKAIRTEYRRVAMNDPKKFIDTYNDTSVQLKVWIESALQNGSISTQLVPNQAVWSAKGTLICDISGLSSYEGILNKLIEFAKSEDGSEFNEILTVLYN